MILKAEEDPKGMSVATGRIGVETGEWHGNIWGSDYSRLGLQYPVE